MTRDIHSSSRRAFRLSTGALALCALALVAAGSAAQAPSSAVSNAYDAAVKGKTASPEISFGHDVDVKGKAWEFMLTLADKVKIPQENLESAKGVLLNVIDLRESTKDSGLTEAEINRFAVKTLLDKLSPKEVIRVKKLLGLNNKQTRFILENGMGLLEGGAQAAGEASAGDMGAIDTALLTAVDTLCPECAVARKGALLVFEAGKAVEAWAEDETTRKQFDTWKEDGVLLTTKGFGPTMSAARRALVALYESKGRKTPPTTAEVEQFVKSQFESWKQGQADAERDTHVLDEVKDDYLKLSDYDRHAFGGKTDQENATGFADTFLPIYQQLIAAQGNKVLPPAGREKLLQDAVMLAHVRASDGDGAYRDRMFDTLRHYGWIPAVSAARKNAIRDRLVQRLPNLSYANLKALLDYAQMNGADGFYGCLCGQLPGVGIGKVYAPAAGGPCHLFGYGTWNEGFPADRKAWNLCLAVTKVGDKTFADAVADRIITWTAIK